MNKKKMKQVAAGAVSALALLSGPGLVRAAETTSEEDVTLNWMISGTEYEDSELIAKEFNEKLHEVFPHISISLESVAQQSYQQAWDMKMAGNGSVDIACMNSESVPFSEEVKKGNLMALDYLLSTYGGELMDSIPEELWDKQKRDADSIYGIPVDGPLYRNNRVLVANKALADRYADWDQILRVNQSTHYTTAECYVGMTDFLEKAKENNALGTGVSYSTIADLADKGYEGIFGEDSPYVIRIFDDYPVVYNKYSLPSYKATYEVMSDWYHKGYIREDAAYVLNPTELDGKRTGNILYLDEIADDEVGYAEDKPEYETVEGDLEGYHFISYETCRNVLVLPKTCRYPTEAMQVINYLNSEEGRDLFQLLVYGNEKEQYIKVDEDSDVIARMTARDHSYRYGLRPCTIGSMYQGYELYSGQFEEIEENNETAIHSALEGFELDTRMFAFNLAKIELIVSKYEDELQQGRSDDWETLYEAFLREMNDAGSSSIVTEIQRQIDAFMKNR